MEKIYEVTDIGLFKANSKKEIKEFFGVPMSKINLLEQEPEEKVQDLNILIRKKFDLEEEIEKSRFYTNEPTRTFEIGEPIAKGNLKNYCVTEIHENGKVIVAENEAGEYRISQWHDIFKINKTENKPLFKNREHSLELDFSQGSIKGLLLTYYHFGIDLNPFYQRDLVWTQEQKEFLIDSMFKGIDIGKFVLIKLRFEEDKHGYQILDGKQRLSTIIDFYEDKFKYKGLYFSELNNSDRRRFIDISIPKATVNERNINDKLIVEYFVNLNISGIPVEKDFIQNLVKEYL